MYFEAMETTPTTADPIGPQRFETVYMVIPLIGSSLLSTPLRLIRSMVIRLIRSSKDFDGFRWISKDLNGFRKGFRRFFEGCRWIFTSKKLHNAQNVIRNCYSEAFEGFRRLSKADCRRFFEGCEWILTSKKLHNAQNFIRNCYSEAFEGFRRLSKVLGYDILCF